QAAPGGRRTRLPGHVRRPNPRSEDAAMTTERLRPLAALALVALLAAGCGSDAPAETSTVRKPATGQAKAVKFAECIRSHGVPHFPDANAKGEYVFGIDVTPAVWQKAVNACKA